MKPYKSERKIGIAQILLSGLCFGFLGIFGKMAYANGLSPGELLSLRFTFGGLMLLVFLLMTRPQSLKLSNRELGVCAILGILGYAVFSSCYFQALKGLSASLTVLLLYTYPLIVAIGAWLCFSEKIAKDRWLALPLVMVGLVMLIWGDFQVLNPNAILFGLASAFFYSIYILVSSRFLKNTDALAAVTYIQLSAGAVLTAIHWREFQRFEDVVAGNWLLLCGMSLISSVFAMSLFLAGLKKLKNWETSVLSTAEPVTGILLAVLLLGESFSPLQIVGASAVLGAFIVIALPKRREA
jgi:drug/metabolite transporter (DMT)-like permease